MQYPLLFGTLFLGLSMLFAYERIPSTIFFSDASPRRDTCWAETVVHPVLLWHPFPRNVLISGSGTRNLIKESLRHFATTPIHWIDSSSHDLTTEDDILGRTVRHSTPYSSGNSTFDVIILDDPPFPELVSEAATQLSSGGVLAVALGDPWGQALPKALSIFKHVHVFLPYDSTGRSSHYAVATNSDDYPVPSHLSVAHVNTLIGRRVAPKSSLEHYDGEVHLRNFLLPRQVRVGLRDIYQKSIRPAPVSPNLSLKHEEEFTLMSHPTAITSTQDYVRCSNLPSSEKDAIGTVLDSLKNGEANHRGISSKTWNPYQNITTYYVPPGLDTDTIQVSPVLDSSTPSNSLLPAQLTVTAIFDGGSLSLHIFPHLGLARASVTNFNGWVSSEEILDTLSVEFDPERITGSQHLGPPHLVQNSTLDKRLSHFGDRMIGTVDYWKFEIPYWTSPKVVFSDSSLAGKGNWATENISKGEVLFKGAIEASLVHIEEYKLYPEWKKLYSDHYGEHAHEEIYSTAGRADEDLRFVAYPKVARLDHEHLIEVYPVSYYTNHACSPNLKYDDSYDEMVAIKDIGAGEELTFDYATVSSEPEYELECKCGGTSCRHKVTGKDWRDKGVISKLGKDAFWPYLKAKILKIEMEKR